MHEKVISDLPDDRYAGRRALVRGDFNVSIDMGRIREDYELRRAIPTIEHLSQRGAKVILANIERDGSRSIEQTDHALGLMKEFWGQAKKC